MTDLSQRETPQPDSERLSREGRPGSRVSIRRRAVKRWTTAAALALAVALLAVACGGGGRGEISQTPSPTGEGNGSVACQALQALRTYRYTVDLTLEVREASGTPSEPQPSPRAGFTREPSRFDYQIDASFVAPDRYDALLSSSDEGPFLNMITVGSRSWVLLGDAWKPYGQQDEPGVPYRPSVICEAILPDLDLSQATPSEVKINGVDALHYTFSQAPSEHGMAGIFGEGSDADILIKNLDVGLWLAKEDNWPVRLEINGRGLYVDNREILVYLAVDVRDANDDSIRVEPPL